MVTKNNRTFSPEALEFRRLDKSVKYKKLIEFCEKNDRTPSTSNVTETERVLGQFYINSKSAQKNDTLEQWEIDELEKAHTYSSKREPRINKIRKILAFCLKHEKTPSQSSRDKEEKKLGQSLNTVKNSIRRKALTEEEEVEFNKIMEFRSNYQRSRDEKLQDVLEFCVKAGRTPKQHVRNKDEKRMAEFLSTTRILDSKNELEPECKKILKQINKYAPLTRTEKLNLLKAYAKNHQCAPSMNSNTLEERQLATFFTKMKSSMKSGKLTSDEQQIMDDVLNLCNVKTRLQKIQELHAFVKRHGHIPKLNSNNEDERKFAMRLNNIKQANKNGKLKSAEVDVLEQIENLQNSPHTSFA